MINFFKKNNGFTALEVLVAVAIIAILSAIFFISNQRIKERTYLSRANVELKAFAYALKMYAFEHSGIFPADVDRDIPSGLENYLEIEEEWPSGPWPGSIYDWDNWTVDGEKIYQISIRFCPVNGPLSECHFPNESWAQNFDINSAYYYCISGSCRAHSNELLEYPGYCMNCDSPS